MKWQENVSRKPTARLWPMLWIISQRKRACDREAEGIRGEVEYRTLEQESDDVDE